MEGLIPLALLAAVVFGIVIYFVPVGLYIAALSSAGRATTTSR